MKKNKPSFERKKQNQIILTNFIFNFQKVKNNIVNLQKILIRMNLDDIVLLNLKR